MRKSILTLLVSMLLLAIPISGRCQEVDLAPTPTPAPIALTPLSRAALLETPPLHPACAAVLLAEADSGQVIFEMNADVPRPVASVTKMMTILLTLEALDAGRLSPGDVVTVSEAAAGMGGSQVLLDVNERQTVGTLLKCMIVGSANDAAVALAEALFGSEALMKWIIAIAVLFSYCGICAVIDVSPLLGCMAMGMVYINTTDDERMFRQLNYFSPPILLLFFFRSGFFVDVSDILLFLLCSHFSSFLCNDV